MYTIRKTNLFTTSVIMLFLFSLIGFWGCENGSLDPIDSEKAELHKLASKYGINISIDDTDDCGESLKVLDKEELETLFAELQKTAGQKIMKNMQLSDSEKLTYTSRTKFDIQYPVIRLKSGGMENSWNDSSWCYNLTWMNVDINPAGEVHTYFTGATMWNYKQHSSHSYQSGDTLYYNASGVASVKVGSGSYGVNVNVPVKVNGWINTSTGEGKMNVQDKF